MPYIAQSERQVSGPPETPGQLNYRITLLLDGYVSSHGLSYRTINDIVGVLECAKQEFYRRIAALYEDNRMKWNGDVYESVKEIGE